MGTDKAFLMFGGQTLLDRACGVVVEACGKVALVGDRAKLAEYESSNYGPVKYGPILADIFSGCGPLAGIHVALQHSSAELNLMLAVDMPFVSGDLLNFLFAAAETSDAIVTVPRAGKGLQPLCAVYRGEFALAAEKALRAGKYKIDALFSSISIRVIEDGQLAEAGFSERSFFNVNTPQDRVIAEEHSS